MPFGEPWTLILVSISVVISGLMCVKEIIQWLREPAKLLCTKSPIRLKE